MANIGNAVRELHEMDALAAGSSPVHSLHPLAKLIMTIAYIIVTASFGRYELTALIIMVLYPAVIFSVSGISVRTCFYKLRIVLPIVCVVGAFNPIFDHSVIAVIGSTAIWGGVISMLTLMIKGVFCLMAAFSLIATTKIDDLCAALRKIHVPAMITTLFLLTYRYLSVFMEEIEVMTMAYKLRAPGERGIHISAWGSFIGQALLRSMDRAEELYFSMQIRGYEGNMWYAGLKKAGAADYIVCILTVCLILVCRVFNVTLLIGNIFT